MTSSVPRSALALAEMCDPWTQHPWEIIRGVARDAGPAMRDVIVTAGRWDGLTPTPRAGVVWDMTTAHTIAGTEEQHVRPYDMGVRMTRLGNAIRHAHNLSSGRPFGVRTDAEQLAENVNTRLLRLPEGWQAEALRRVAEGELNPLGAVSQAAMSTNIARHVYGLPAE